MEKNVGTTDKQVRTAVGAIAGLVSLAILAGVVPLPVLLSPILGVVALIMLGTAATGSCPLYTIAGIQTCPVESESEAPQ